MAMRGLPLTQAEELYALYPLKVGKKKALTSIANALKLKPFEYLKEKVTEFANSPAGQHHGRFEGYHPPYPATWFNQGRYDDDTDTWYSMDAKRLREIELAKEANVGVWRPI